MPLYPLKFRPLFKRYLWGGRRLGTVLGKPIGEGEDYAESWEIADHAQGQSIVANGPLEGTTLHELVLNHGEELFGRHAERHGGRSLQRGAEPRFPLIFKYLDAHQNLSVQVHPTDEAAAKLDPPDLGKTEAWVILDAPPGSRVYAGLTFGMTRESLAREVAAGRTEICLQSLAPRAGDCLFIPAGTVHALGAGLLIAEIQQASDTTYRLYDWNRLGPDGKPRPLHVEQSLDAIDYSTRAIHPQRPKTIEDQPHIERLVECDKFVLDRWRLEKLHTLGGDERFHILSVLEGEVLLSRSGESIHSHVAGSSTSDEVSLLSLIRGQTVLLPASLGPVTIAGRERAALLDMYLP
jgi:mannose-6-phosphate isomerase